jgi:hypothetical protein
VPEIVQGLWYGLQAFGGEHLRKQEQLQKC